MKLLLPEHIQLELYHKYEPNWMKNLKYKDKTKLQYISNTFYDVDIIPTNSFDQYHEQFSEHTKLYIELHKLNNQYIRQLKLNRLL